MLDTVIQKKIASLPENIRHAVETFDWATEILHIANDHHLQIDTVEVFRRETLLVIVGLTDAADFEKNLANHMEIPHETAEQIVADANEHIFRPLQKMAFTHHDSIEQEIIEHDKISEVMSSHGIELVDEFEPEPQPKNELQDLANSLFKTAESVIPNQTLNNKSKVELEIPEIASQVRNDKVVEYNEPIEEKDLHGISGHRTNTDIIKHLKPETFSNNIQSLEKKILTTTHISRTESFDMSPSKEEQIVENGDFLKHIGAS